MHDAQKWRKISYRRCRDLTKTWKRSIAAGQISSQRANARIRRCLSVKKGTFHAGINPSTGAEHIDRQFIFSLNDWTGSAKGSSYTFIFENLVRSSIQCLEILIIFLYTTNFYLSPVNVISISFFFSIEAFLKLIFNSIRILNITEF